MTLELTRLEATDGAPRGALFLPSESLLMPDVARTPEQILGYSIAETSDRLALDYLDILPGGVHQIADVWVPTHWIHAENFDETDDQPDITVQQLRFASKFLAATVTWQHIVYREGSMSVTQLGVDRRNGNISGWHATYTEVEGAIIPTVVRDLSKYRQVERAWQNLLTVFNSQDAIQTRDELRATKLRAEEQWDVKSVAYFTHNDGLVSRADVDLLMKEMKTTFPGSELIDRPTEAPIRSSGPRILNLFSDEERLVSQQSMQQTQETIAGMYLKAWMDDERRQRLGQNVLFTMPEHMLRIPEMTLKTGGSQILRTWQQLQHYEEIKSSSVS